MYIYIYGPRDWVSIQRFKNWYLMPPNLTLSIKNYRSRIKWSNPEKGVMPSLHLSIIATETGAFGSPLTTVANFTYLLYIYIYIYIYICLHVSLKMIEKYLVGI